MRNLRCWLFGHEWIETAKVWTNRATGEHRTTTAYCSRCEMTIGFVEDDDDDRDEVDDA
ncbi:hypothetical protein [Halorubrum lipolyticum]|uniref:hypothetical protein n=1 Tax=Halorubrum lipolyticum TaxID=368624 RepID=UPI000AA8AD32|nr:hypothetical protein [Halorubrum lipolyticum]